MHAKSACIVIGGVPRSRVQHNEFIVNKKTGFSLLASASYIYSMQTPTGNVEVKSMEKAIFVALYAVVS